MGLCVNVVGEAQVPVEAWVYPTRKASKHFSHPLDPCHLAGKRAVLHTLSLSASSMDATYCFHYLYF